MGVMRDSGTSSWRTSSSRSNERADTRRLNSSIRSSRSRRNSRNNRVGVPNNSVFHSSGSRRSRRNYYRPSLNYESDKKSVLNNAPDKQVTQSYQLAENPNPFMKDVLSMGQKYNTYQRQIANPEYNEYIDKQNNKYNKKYDNFRWGNYNWNDLAQNDFESEQKLTGFYNNTGNNFMNNSATLSMAKKALFG